MKNLIQFFDKNFSGIIRVYSFIISLVLTFLFLLLIYKFIQSIYDGNGNYLNELVVVLFGILFFLLAPQITSLKWGDKEVNFVNEKDLLKNLPQQNKTEKRKPDDKSKTLQNKLSATHGVQIKDDPNKNQFGCSPVWNERRLSAEIIPFKSANLYQIIMKVSSLNIKKPLIGEVQFILHPTFSPVEWTVSVINGEATHRVIATGAFTIGTIVKENTGDTFLELDLNSVNGGDESFYS